MARIECGICGTKLTSYNNACPQCGRHEYIGIGLETPPDKEKKMTAGDEMKPEKETTFEELADIASSKIHLAMLEGGGQAFKDAVYLWLGQAILWNDERRIHVPRKEATKKRTRRIS
jgi:hypothetical protein